MIKSDDIIENLLLENRSIYEDVRVKFSSVSFDILNHSPGRNEWSIAECFDHLIVTNNQYIPLIESKLKENGDTKTEAAGTIDSTFAGRFMIYSLNPDNKRKLKTPRVFRPEIKVYTKEVIKFFLDQNNHIYKLMYESRGKNLNEIKIQSPVTRLLKFNLYEVFRIINVHERRHINQAQEILKKIP